jgi:hypothetical protein
MTRKTRKRLIRFLLIPVIILLVLISVAVIILNTQQERLVRYGLNELNKEIPGKIVVGGSDISIFQNFPYISIRLKNVQLFPDKQASTKPICEAEGLFVGFSLPDMLKEEYHVKALAMKNGHVDLVQTKDGKMNIIEALQMVEDSTATKDTSSKKLDLDVKKLVLKNMNISFVDEESGQQVVAKIEKIKSAIRLDSTLLSADLQSTMVVDYSTKGNSTIFHNKHVGTDIEMSYDMASKFLKLPKGKLKLEEAVFNVVGTADLLHNNLVDFKIDGDEPDMKHLFAFAPENVTKELKNFRYDGHLNFHASIKGNLVAGQQPLVELTFSCDKCWLHNTTSNKKLDSLGFKGYYTNGPGHNLQTSELRILDMSARPEKGSFTGDFVLRDFTDPKILMRVNSELELEFIGAFLGIKDLERITGHINLKMNFKELVDLDLPEKQMGKLTEGIQSELTVTNLTFRIPHYPYNIEHLNLHANMKNGFLKLDSLSCSVGSSDFHLNGSINDIPALFHDQEKPVTFTLNANSSKIVMKELLAFDTARANKSKEEVNGFNIGLVLETSVHELLHPHLIPKGELTIQNLNAGFKRYPHTFHDFAAHLTINDTSLRLKDFVGRIDSSDIHLSGRVNNYPLWFDKVKKGRTEIAFDLKSQRLALREVLGRKGRTFLPPDYAKEVATNVWLRSKTDLRYDTVFKFAKIHIANISGDLLKHQYHLDSISGTVKIGADNFIKMDTLVGKIGNSDFNINMRLYAGEDTVKRKKENFLLFSSKLLDVDQLTNYWATAESIDSATLADAPKAATIVTTVSNTGDHTTSFNIFEIPFIDFRATVNIGKIRYHKLGMKNFYTNIRMQQNQQLTLDTLGLTMAGGTITASGTFNGADPKKIFLKSKINLEDVNLEKMMLKMDRLGQDYVINKNIQGTFSGQIDSYLLLHPDFTPIIDQSEAKLDIEIINGVLINFAPMQAMSSYFKDKNLNMVRFDTLENTLTFKNGVLDIPEMNINSSLGFMEISGKQSMDTHMEYYVRVPLKMVTSIGFQKLFGKKQEEINADQVDAIQYRDKDKKYAFMNLAITGTPDNYNVKLGKAKKSAQP